jgi:hypothetical protein
MHTVQDGTQGELQDLDKEIQIRGDRCRLDTETETDTSFLTDDQHGTQQLL